MNFFVTENLMAICAKLVLGYYDKRNVKRSKTVVVSFVNGYTFRRLKDSSWNHPDFVAWMMDTFTPEGSEPEFVDTYNYWLDNCPDAAKVPLEFIDRRNPGLPDSAYL